MQRYHPASCTGAVNNSGIGGVSARDTGRAESSPLPTNFSINSCRFSRLTPYKLKCEKEPLNPRLGPPDFLPQSPTCPEETLTREYVHSGYRETVEGLEEAREISFSQVTTFTKPVVLKCKEAIRKCHRTINESRAQKRKAGQVYGVPLSATLLSKSGVFPEQKACGEDFRKRWIEGLSQYHKSLRLLADHVPHGYKKRLLFEVLVRNNVPLLRATWFIKVTYLNQIRPGSSGSPDKSQLSRTKLWTKDVTDYLQCLLDEYLSKNNAPPGPQNKNVSPQTLYAGSLLNKNDPSSAVLDGEEPSLHLKWWYVVRILQWHLAEGLIVPSPLIDWVLLQLQEKDLLQVLQFLLPLIYGVFKTIILSQTYVHNLVEVALRFLRDTSPGVSDLVDNSRRVYTMSALIEMVQYLVLAVPDTFVGLDCFPLPRCVMNYASNEGSSLFKLTADSENLKNAPTEVSHTRRNEGLDAKYQSSCFNQTVSSIKKRATYLAKAASAGYLGQNEAKAVQALDKALLLGDIQEAYKFLFEDLSDAAVLGGWIREVNPSLMSSMKWIGSVSLSLVRSVFLLCEWCTCDFRDFRTAPLHELKFTGRKDFSQIYIAVRLLKLKMKHMQRPKRCMSSHFHGVLRLDTVHGLQNKAYDDKTNTRNVDRRSVELSELFESPGPLHDIIVCWLDQHEARKGEGSKRLELLLVELLRSGIFYPQAYVRQLVVSGVMDRYGPVIDLDKWKKHFQILKQLPGPYLHDVLGEAQIAEMSLLLEVLHVYSNERRLLLRGQLSDDDKNLDSKNTSSLIQKQWSASERDVSSPSVDQLKSLQSVSIAVCGKRRKDVANIEDLKAAISALLQLPDSSAADAGVYESSASAKRTAGFSSNKMDLTEGSPSCEECQRAKRQKLSEERSAYFQGPSPNPLDDEDAWWVRKEPKFLEPLKTDPPLKTMKQASRGRQKTLRKTQSLAQLAAARIEGSQGASTSHLCDNRVGCPHHRMGVEEASKSLDGINAAHCRDVVSIGNKLKQLRLVKKRTVAVWLMTAVKQLVEETERTASKLVQFNRSFSSDDGRSPIRWKLGEDELSVILYLMDISNELSSAVRFLIWLLPKALNSSSAPLNGGRNTMMLQRNLEIHPCEVGESFLLSSIRRYENILVTADLVPEVLSAAMRRVSIVMASNGRISGSSTFFYARDLLKKYGNISSVREWEKNFKATSDRRLLSELESERLQSGEFGVLSGVPAGVEDYDDFIRQKITGNRLSRAGMSMREIVQRYVDEMLHHLFGKEKKPFGVGAQKTAGIEKCDDGYQIAQQIILGLLDCIRQTGGAAQEGDPSLVSSAVSAIVSNVGPAIAKMPDFTVVNNHSNLPLPTDSLSFARRILRVHINCLGLLKDALGERHRRAFEISLAIEASSALAGTLSPVKAPRGQFQLSPEAHVSNANMPNEVPNNSQKVIAGRATRIAAAVSALVVGSVVHGVASLERMARVFRLREGLDVMQFVRNTKSNSNGNARSVAALKVENSLEVYVHWFRLLVGNCKTVSDGLVVELLGEPSVVALSRMQRTLPLDVVLPPAYSIFALMLWRPYIFNSNITIREDIHQLFQSLSSAIGDAIKHVPFRDVVLRDTHGFYDVVTSDSTDSEFAANLELNGSDRHLKSKAFVPLRARLFLNAIIDCKLPHSVPLQDDGSRISGLFESKLHSADTETNISDKLLYALDTLQPAKFHWQWVELRLFLNEQTLIEKLDSSDALSIAEVMRSLSHNPEKAGASENEKYFTEIVLTRLLVRPDAAALFSEVVHLFGRSIEDSLLLQVKWFLGGPDVLFGRKSIRQRLVNIAESKGFSTKAQFWKPWGWSHCSFHTGTNRGDKRKFEAMTLEEGEVGEEADLKRHGRGPAQVPDVIGLNPSQQLVTERALLELVLPCIDQSSDDSRSSFASDLIKQMNNIEHHISGVTCGASKQAGTSPSGTEVSTSKASNRKSSKGGSPGLARRPAGATDYPPSTPAALRSSMSLRLQLLLRLLPSVCADGEPSGRNMRFMLASAILRLLGSRIMYEDADASELQMEDTDAVSVDLCGKNLFDWLLLVLHALLSNKVPSWLKEKTPSKASIESLKVVCGVDREMAESLQNELDHLQLPYAIRSRIQAAMPTLPSNARSYISCQPSSVSTAALASLQPSTALSSSQPGLANPSPPKPSAPLLRAASNTAGKSKSAPSLQPDPDSEIDPWMLLEDGTSGTGQSASNGGVMSSSDHANHRASSLLKGAIRVRRTDLTYIGTVDDDG
ncbi:hypothetical protein Nepgr_033149 [Nepenthes gracilis]|uniref:Mediator complex subunit Med12 domain-containing protein n=1 Tax=Nepenthes gracilis TaxID=150966 RepID=A0AAD3Y8T7_NEPGR|nr:hypothetical protein Nepgr_033149 [Nepenthes gracilis]